MENVVNLYRKRAKNYDKSHLLYYLAGFRFNAYREQAIAKLNLKTGDTVIEIGCGTGVNFPIFQKYIGPSGKIIGFDITDAMLEQAKKRVALHGWKNVELIQADAEKFHFDQKVNAVFESFALSLAPNPGKVIENAIKALTPGGRMVILDLKLTDSWIGKLTPLFMLFAQPFGVNQEAADRRPWKKIEKSIRENLSHVTLEELYMGFAYIMEGEKA